MKIRRAIIVTLGEFSRNKLTTWGMIITRTIFCCTDIEIKNDLFKKRKIRQYAIEVGGLMLALSRR